MKEVYSKDLSYQVMAAAFEVHNILGSGFLEKVYENALRHELQQKAIHVESQKEIAVCYKGQNVGTYCPDLVVNNEIILELKATETLSRQHAAQMLNYLKATGVKLGILINFGSTKVEFKRFVL